MSNIKRKYSAGKGKQQGETKGKSMPPGLDKLGITPSEEQNHIYSLIANGHNIQVDSVAGSGKTTTCMIIAIKDPGVRHLCITYNKKLKEETRLRIESAGLTNLEAHNYHAFWYHYYDTNINDVHMGKRLADPKLRPKPGKKINFARLFIDECQDMRPVFFKLIKQVLRDNMHPNPQMILFGDRYQTIYGFQGADNRFLTMGDQLYQAKDGMDAKREWHTAKLSISRRITSEMADFINKVMLNEPGGVDRIISHKTSGRKPDYVIANMFNPVLIRKKVLPLIFQLFDEGYKREEIAVLAYSVKQSCIPIRELGNALTQCKIPIFIPVSDEETINDEVCKGKIVMSTFHQFKGLERKAVIVMGFDASIFKYYMKGADTTRCPDILYVAATRAKERLILVHGCFSDYLPFLKKSELNKYAAVHRLAELAVRGDAPEKVDAVHTISVTELISHVPAVLMGELLEHITLTEATPSEPITIVTKSPATWAQGNGLVENVADITGVAVPAYYEMMTTGRCTILNDLRKYSDEKIGFELPKRDGQFTDIAQLLKVATTWSSLNNGFDFKRVQMIKYDWLGEKQLEACVNRMFGLDLDPKAGRYEVPVQVMDKPELQGRGLAAKFDYMDNGRLFEFKTTGELSGSHVLQLCCYMYINKDYQQRQLLNRMEGTDEALSTLTPETLKVGDSVYYYEEDSTGVRTRAKSVVAYPQVGRVTTVSQECVTLQTPKHTVKQIWFSDSKEPAVCDTLILNISCLARHHPDMIPKYKYYLANLLSGQLLEIQATPASLALIIDKLMSHKFKKEVRISDSEFLATVDTLL
jgi:hypothetical protein